MRHPDHPARPPRTDPRSTRPTGPAGSSPGRRTARTPHRPTRRGTDPIPATVWICGAGADEADAGRSAPVLAKVITAFTAPGAHVVLLVWPHLGSTTPAAAGHPPGRIAPAVFDLRLPAALHVAQGLGRTAHMIGSTPGTGTYPPVSRPHRDDPVGDPQDGDDPRTIPPPTPAPGGLDTTMAGADLVITSVAPEHADDRAGTHVAATAAGLLRTGGVLTVLTHSDWSGGRLLDPTGPIVTAAQHADLLYLQHIVLIHAPVRDGQFVTHAPAPGEHDDGRSDRPAPTPRAPAAHRRIHTDLLAFAQPRDHHPLPSAAAAHSTTTTG